MLSSTADHLYWMARYMERAENTARMLDVTHRMSLLPQATAEPHQEWGAVLSICGLHPEFAQSYPEINAGNVLRFMVLDAGNPSSILSCLGTARENARAVRGSITSEMWETLNATWLEVRGVNSETLETTGISEFFDWVKERSHLFRGVTHGTILRDEAFHFIRLGTFLERADNTARILDVKYHILLPSVQDVGGAVDYYQWGAVLRSVSAFESYRKVYRDVITPWRVAALLMLREDMPRSLHACMNEVQQIVTEIGGPGACEVRRRAGELHAALHCGRMEDIFQGGLHEYLTEFLAKTKDLSEHINRTFLLPSACV